MHYDQAILPSQKSSTDAKKEIIKTVAISMMLGFGLGIYSSHAVYQRGYTSLVSHETPIVQLVPTTTTTVTTPGK